MHLQRQYSGGQLMPPLTPLSLDDSLITSLAVRQDVRVAKVLIVDRDPDFVESLRRVVSEAGYPTVGAHTAIQALATIKSEGCQIVILDREMPEIDGLVLCAAIRAARVLPGYVYIILRSSQDSEKDILIGLQAGADEYVSKQMPATQLIARLMTAQRILALEHGLRSTLEERTHWAMTDSLTGVRNRRCFDLELRRDLKIARRYGGDLSLIVIDVDNFKAVNDQHGHAVGDEVLGAVATPSRRPAPAGYRLVGPGRRRRVRRGTAANPAAGRNESRRERSGWRRSSTDCNARGADTYQDKSGRQRHPAIDRSRTVSRRAAAPGRRVSLSQQT